MQYFAPLIGLTLSLLSLSASAASPYGPQPMRYYAQPPAWYFVAPQQRINPAFQRQPYYRPAPTYSYRQPYQQAPAYQQPPIEKKTQKILPKKAKSSNKMAFLQKIAPMIHTTNKAVAAERTELLGLIQHMQRGYAISPEQQKWLKSRLKTYRVKGDISIALLREQLLPKIDVIPIELALAQAANESAWGKSRFAVEAKNLFGIWTYDESQGIVPKQRTKGAKHLIRKYASIEASIQHYITLLNSHPAYSELRTIRLQQRNKRQQLDAVAMAAGLIKYSAKGEQYVAIIRSMIQSNNLTDFRAA